MRWYIWLNPLYQRKFSLRIVGPRLPYLFDGFQANVEANIINKQKTVSAIWYFDYPGNRAAIKLFENGLDGQLIFNFKTDEIYKVSGISVT